jgi:hypothetical protein
MMTSRYRSLFFFLVIGIGLSFVLTQGRCADPGSSEITLKPISYAGLTDAVRGHKGKVVVVDVWAEY